MNVLDMLIVIISILLIFVVYSVWHNKYKATPVINIKHHDTHTGNTHNGYKKDPFEHKTPEEYQKMICEDNVSCATAFSSCVPIAQNIMTIKDQSPGSIINALNTPDLKTCVNALTGMDAAFTSKTIAKFSKGGGSKYACVPANMASLYSNEKDFNALLAVTNTTLPLVPYALNVAKNLPLCT
jgi:hypothetical protein